MKKKKNGSMVKVDAWYVPAQDAPRYIEARERCAKAALDEMRFFCASAAREWAGSQDGEAVVGCDERGEIIAMIHLDPEGVSQMEQAIKDGALRELLTL